MNEDKEDERKQVIQPGTQISSGIYATTFGACPKCEHPHASAQAMEVSHPEPPKPHDLTVCTHCGELLEFDEHLKTISLSPEIFESLDPGEKVQLLNIQRLART